MEKVKPIIITKGIEAVVKEDGNIWGALLGTNALVKISMVDWKLELVAKFPDLDDNEIGLFADVVANDGKLYFAPRNANYIAIYDIEGKTFKKIMLDSQYESRKQYKFYNVKKYGNFAYFFPHTYGAIVKLNLINNDVKYITEPIKKLFENQSHKVKGTDIIVCATLVDDIVYAGGGYNSNKILAFNLKDESFEISDISTSTNNIGFAIKRNEKYIFNSYMDYRTYAFSNEADFEILDELNGGVYFRSIYKDGDIYLFNHSCDGKSIAYITKDKEIKFLEGVSGAIYGVIEDKGVIYAIDSLCSTIYKIKCDNQTYEKYYIGYSNQETENLCKNIGYEVVREGEMSIEDYIKYVIND